MGGEYLSRDSVIDIIKERIDCLEANMYHKKGFQTAIINLAFVLGVIENLPTFGLVEDSIQHVSYDNAQMGREK